MICGRLENFEAQGLGILGDAARRAVAWIRAQADPPEGRVELAYENGGDPMYGVALRYLTGPRGASRFETHRRYVDLQYMIAGQEIMEWVPRAELPADGGYDRERDLLFHHARHASAAAARLVVVPGSFVIFTPLDAHRGGIRVPRAAPGVFKLVVKIPVCDYPSAP